jgi:hypothetical protein
MTKLPYCFGFVFLTTIIKYISIFKLWRDTSVWSEQNFEDLEDKNNDNFYFSELKDYVVLVKGIPENAHAENSSEEIKKILRETYLNQLVDFKIVG